MRTIDEHLDFEVGGLTKPALRTALGRRGIQLNEYGERLFEDERWSVSSKPYEVRTVVVRVSDLCPGGMVTSEEVYAAAGKAGLAVCPLEVGPYMRLQYEEQREEPRLTLASTRVSEDESFPAGFYLSTRGDGLWLRGYTASLDYAWSPEERFVFVCR